jgi:hypothetical protein
MFGQWMELDVPVKEKNDFLSFECVFPIYLYGNLTMDNRAICVPRGNDVAYWEVGDTKSTTIVFYTLKSMTRESSKAVNVFKIFLYIYHSLWMWFYSYYRGKQPKYLFGVNLGICCHCYQTSKNREVFVTIDSKVGKWVFVKKTFLLASLSSHRCN